ncbi:hypothetical protein TNCV_2636761 [Trichonephila clavipes]|uniref:Uncharacterized protein n=1 Tax=Trichonephila clavipes TaxID=2585209 RepID=A0A8X6R871_TRICX|nr:hypothetical protein TNCV_2636761 [Trichonephila clavipes]
MYNEHVRKEEAVGRLVVRASGYKLEGLGSLPAATIYPPSTHGVRARKINGLENLEGGRSRNHGCRGRENIFLSPPVPFLTCGDRRFHHLSCRNPTSLTRRKKDLLKNEYVDTLNLK